MKIRLYKFVIAILISCMAILFCCNAKSNDECYFKIDTGTSKGSEKESDTVSNLRIVTKGKYKLKEISSKYGVDKNYVVDTKGLDTLNISGSRQYSKSQFLSLVNTLKECASGKDIYIIDLREESHEFFNGYPISWYKSNNTANVGKTYDEVIADENSRFLNQIGKTITAYQKKSSKGESKSKEITISENLTEKQLIKIAIIMFHGASG